MFKIHYSMYFTIAIIIYLKQIELYLLLIFLILIHEISHMIVAKLFGYEIKSLTLYPYGGVLEYNKKNNKYELLVFIAGPLSNLIMILFGFYIKYNIIILVFNLIPIYPLDGFKILNCIFKRKVIYFSYLLLLILVIIALYNKNSMYLLISIYLLYKNIEYLSRKTIYELQEIVYKVDRNKN